MLRLFFALTIPTEFKQKLFSSFPRKSFPGIRFTPLENLHITAHFLGATSEENIPTIIQRIKEISESTSPFELRSNSFKIVFQKEKPTMIWVQFEENSFYEN